MALRGAIASLTQGGPYTVTRTATGTLTKGNYSSGAVTTLSVAGSLQPVTGRELRDLPEGQRGDDVRVLYTLTALRTIDAGGEADKVTIDGESFTVFKVERFDAFGETHYRVWMARTERP